MTNIRPMLSVEGAEEVNKALAGKAHAIPFPVIAQVKFDGFRVTIINGLPMSRTMKAIPNEYVQKCFASVWGGWSGLAEDNPLNGLDGELIALDPETLEELDLHQTQSRLNTRAGSPRFVFHAFDDVSEPNLSYIERQTNLNARLKRIRNHVSQAVLETNPERRSKRIHDHVFQAVESRICERVADIVEFENECLEWGAEGIMLKRPDSKYKFGRATLKGFESVKVKRFTDAEAEIVGFNEKMHNLNDAEKDERGYTKRSSAKDGLVPANTLGNLILKWINPEGQEIEFEIGTGWDAATAKSIWSNRAEHYGDKVNFKFKGVGPNGKPLIPSFQGIRYDV